MATWGRARRGSGRWSRRSRRGSATSRWRRSRGFEARAPISGQRALRVETLRATLPFARGFGMEIGMTVDAVRAGYRVGEYEIDLEHRATGRDARGFLHRAVQLRDFTLVFASRLRR
jgi:hypothetical protein